MDMDKCPKCGSSDIDNKGFMMGGDRVYYYPGTNRIIAPSCNNCGYMELYKEIKK